MRCIKLLEIKGLFQKKHMVRQASVDVVNNNADSIWCNGMMKFSTCNRKLWVKSNSFWTYTSVCGKNFSLVFRLRIHNYQQEYQQLQLQAVTLMQVAPLQLQQSLLNSSQCSQYQRIMPDPIDLPISHQKSIQPGKKWKWFFKHIYLQHRKLLLANF